MIFSLTSQKYVRLIGVRLLFISFIACYIVLGGLVIQRIELSAQQQRVRLGIAKNDTEIADASEVVQNARRVDERMIQDWSLSSSILYAFSMLTTIGYGHVAPVTIEGRIFSMFYGIFGIPLTMMVIADIGKFIAEFLRWVHRRTRRYCLIMKKKVFTATHSGAIQDSEQLEVETESPKLLIICCFIFWLFLGGLIFPLYEKNMNSAISAIYFAFISISTIGFGDISPERYSYLPITLLYLLIGLAMMTMVVEVMGEYLRKLHFHGRKMPNLKNTVIWFGGKKMTVDEVMRGVLKEMNVDGTEAVANLDHVIQKVIDNAESSRRESQDKPLLPEESNNGTICTPSTFDPFLPKVCYIDQDEERSAGTISNADAIESIDD